MCQTDVSWCRVLSSVIQVPSGILHQIFLDRAEVIRMSCVNFPVRIRYHCDPDRCGAIPPRA